MLFSGLPFLYYFLPVTLLLYFAVPKKLKNPVLLLASLIFYGWGEPSLLILMAVSMLCGYTAGLLTEKYHGTKKAKLVLIAETAVSLGILGCFKYADFFIDTMNTLTGLSLPLLHIALPIGISFYTFQTLSYVIDVYRGDARAQKSFLLLALYISMFPQLIAGPIVRYTDIASQLESRTHTLSKAASGVRAYTVGLCKKLLLADVLGELCTSFLATEESSLLFSWMYAIAYTMQIYFDFSGYSDMAVGLGRILGFEMPQNFRYPLISGSITEFWRRWHITLGSWFRDYVYFPLGGSRTTAVKHIRNLLVVWTLTGLWHGASWSFVVWGLYFAVLLIIEKKAVLRLTESCKPLRYIYVVPAILVSFVIFGSADNISAIQILKGMFGMGGLPLINEESAYFMKSFAVVFLLGLVFATPLPKMLYRRVRTTNAGSLICTMGEPLFIAAMLLIATSYPVDGSFSPFLYFRF